MTIRVPFAQLLDQLEKLREEHGEELYQKARREIALSIILKPNGEEFVKKLLPEFDIEALKKEAQGHVPLSSSEAGEMDTDEMRQETDEGPGQPMPPTGKMSDMMIEMLRQQVPNLKTQAHFNTFMACFDAMRHTLDAYFRGDLKAAAQSRDALNTGLDMAGQLKTVADQVAEIPEEERSKAAQEHVAPPAQYTEGAESQVLTQELSDIKTLARLNEWYETNRMRIDKIVDLDLRNTLFDAIRLKRNELRASAN